MLRNYAHFAMLVALGAGCVLSTSAQAGCLTGAAVGGVAGHMAGHHGVLGAAAGCAVGHHEANKNKAQKAAAANQGSADTGSSAPKNTQ